MQKMTMRAALALGLAALMLAGCGDKNPKADLDLRKDRSQNFREQMTQDHITKSQDADAKIKAGEPFPGGTLTLPTAIARAIKHNLDHRVKQMESTVAQEQLAMARLSYLPEVAAMAGYSSRNNEAGAVSRSLLTGEISLEYSTSQEKDHTLSSLRASWDVIDFGLTYFTVSQKTNDIAIAEEQRRKVVQNLIQDVQEAYMRAYIAQELLAEVENIAAESEGAVTRFKGMANRGMVDPKQGLSQQRELLQIRYNMRNLQEQLAQGRIHLNALLNLPPGTNYRLAATPRADLPVIPASAAVKLENMALMNRPELRMEDSKLKTTRAEVKKSILEMMPHVEFWAQASHDTNEYLYNKSWNEVGVQLTWNLLGAAQGLGKHGVYKAEEELAQARHQALSMAVLAQVHLAINRYGIALKKYEDASELAEVSTKLANVAQRDSQREGERGYGRIQTKLQAASSQLESMLAYAEVQNALMRVYNSLGADPLSELNGNENLSELADKVDRHMKKVNETMSY